MRILEGARYSYVLINISILYSNLVYTLFIVRGHELFRPSIDNNEF